MTHFMNHSQRRRDRRRRGITLIEMLVVITIIALFSVVAYQLVTPAFDEGRRAAAQAQIDNLIAVAQLFNLDKGRFPTQEEGIEVLRPYLQKDVPLDPWNHPWVYRYPGQHGPLPDILCYGADGVQGGEGPNKDIVSWR